VGGDCPPSSLSTPQDNIIFFFMGGVVYVNYVLYLYPMNDLLLVLSLGLLAIFVTVVAVFLINNIDDL
jgi:hypothetical protein